MVVDVDAALRRELLGGGRLASHEHHGLDEDLDRDRDRDLDGEDVSSSASGDVDLSRLSAADREAILARVVPDDSVPADAFALAQNEIRREMIDRGIQPKGFYNDDAARLQEEFHREHAAEKDLRRHRALQMAAKTYLRETVQRRQQERARELQEEVAALAGDASLETWRSLVARNETPRFAPQLDVTTIGLRALCKPLAFNRTLHTLGLARNALNDAAATALARMLVRNTTLKVLELEGNALGPLAAKELSAALTRNESLLALNLESNPLTDEEKDWSGVTALSEMLTQNETLRSLNLWRTRLGTTGGKLIANGMEKNTSLLCLDVGNNRVAAVDGARILAQLTSNRDRDHGRESKANELRRAQRAAAQQEKQRQEGLCKQADHETWIEERKVERQAERERQEAERQRQRQLEEDRLRQIAARKALEFAARVEMEKKKKKKGGKKKK